MTDATPAASAALPDGRPDARLVGLHAERGDPQARLEGALADLEAADWGLLLCGEAALARQLAALLGPGTLRVDARVPVSREALAAAGLAAASLDADWRGARAVWLLEPAPEELERARRAGVRVIVDATLAPGGGWLQLGADLLTYRDSVTLTGHGDAPLSALFGLGRAPAPAAPAPADLSVALALRDVSTLPLRLARAARTVALLTTRLGGAAQEAGPTALLLAPDAAADTPQGLGGVMAAARSVPGGVLLTPGLDDVDRALALLDAGEGRSLDAPTPLTPAAAPVEREFTPRRERDRRPERPRPDQTRPEQTRPEQTRPEQARRDERRAARFEPRAEPRPAPRPDAPSQPEVPERFTFDAPDDAARTPAPTAAAPTAEETWEPEIVYSDIAQAQVRLPTPVSSGPDAPNLGDLVPDVRHQPSPEAGAADPAAARAPTPPAADEPAALAPDLPAERVDPAADLTDEQAAVYARLREWRNAEAKRQEISRFIIASNATLAEIARRVPYTEADLKAVKGMGPGRLQKYGQKILEVVRG